MQSWWSVPCGSDFVSHVIADLRRGANVVVCLPDPAPQGLPAELRRRLSESDLFVDEIEATNGSEAPLRLLSSRYLDRHDISEEDPLELLTGDDRFRGRIIFVTGISAGLWPRWSAFLSRFEELCRRVSVIDRTVFCLFLRGQAALSPLRPEVCLSVRTWRGNVQEADMLHYCWMRVRGRDWPDLHRKLGAALAAKIALWDPVVADFLLERQLGDLMRPDVPLQEYARLRGWLHGPHPDNPMEAWALGMMDIVEGRWRRHPALLLNGTDSAELRSRVWSGQVSVLMPMLEEERRTLIEGHRRHIRLPFQTQWGLVACAEDLELQHLSQILSADQQVDPATQKKARRLGRIRNRLAHLEPLDINDLDAWL